MTQKTLEEYLRLTSLMRDMWSGGGDTRLSPEEFVLTYGFKMGPTVDLGMRPQGIPKQCFRNAALLMMQESTLIYCEGFALSAIPVQHAWCCDTEGRVYDTTWLDDRHKTAEYIGVPFDDDFILNWIERNEQYGSVIDDWQNRWPLLSHHGHPSFMHADWRAKLVPTPPRTTRTGSKNGE